jgi:hypothetical protein
MPQFACFRLHGSYEALKYGSLLDGLADLTGGITESVAIRHDPTTCGRLLTTLLEMTSTVTCTVHPASPINGTQSPQVQPATIDGIPSSERRIFCRYTLC